MSVYLYGNAIASKTLKLVKLDETDANISMFKDIKDHEYHKESLGEKILQFPLSMILRATLAQNSKTPNTSNFSNTIPFPQSPNSFVTTNSNNIQSSHKIHQRYCG